MQIERSELEQAVLDDLAAEGKEVNAQTLFDGLRESLGMPELEDLSPEDLWDLIGNQRENREAIRQRHERQMVCALHQESLGKRMERTVWQAYAKRHGLDAKARPAWMNLPQRVKPKGFG